MKPPTVRIYNSETDWKDLGEQSAPEVIQTFDKFDWADDYAHRKADSSATTKYGAAIQVTYRDGRHMLNVQAVSPDTWHATVTLPARIFGIIPGLIVKVFTIRKPPLDLAQTRKILSRFVSSSASAMTAWCKEQGYESELGMSGDRLGNE